MLNKLLSIKKISLDKAKLPKHVAVTIKGHYAWAKKNKKDFDEVYAKGFGIVKNIIKTQVSLNIPIMTLYLLSENMPSLEQFPVYTEALVNFLKSLREDKILHDNKVKISVLGKWYDLPASVVEPIKALIEETKEYDNFFLNFCINYNGQEEIADACRLIARKVKAEKLEPEAIDKAVLKENLYSSSFLAPDLLIITGLRNELSGLLLWDSAYSRIFFANKPWPEFDQSDFLDALRFFQKG